MYLFNNCHNRKHTSLYGSEAFFDLETTGPQAKVADRLANELAVGETCIVATPEITGDITFDWYRFSREIVKRDSERNVPLRRLNLPVSHLKPRMQMNPPWDNNSMGPSAGSARCNLIPDRYRSRF